LIWITIKISTYVYNFIFISNSQTCFIFLHSFQFLHFYTFSTHYHLIHLLLLSNKSVLFFWTHIYPNITKNFIIYMVTKWHKQTYSFNLDTKKSFIQNLNDPHFLITVSLGSNCFLHHNFHQSSSLDSQYINYLIVHRLVYLL
jgi:hypothetical protein